MSDDKKPAIRFKNYSDDWEQRKLGDVVQITMGQSPDGSTYSDEPSDYILVQGNADLQNGWVCPRIWTTQITKKADAGDLIMSVRAPAGAMGKTAYNAVIGRGVAAIKGNEFIYQLLVKMDMDGFWKTLSCGSTFESLNSNNIKNAEVKVPITAEQVQIGNFFQQLDNLITLQHRKYDKLQNLKKAMLEKMFPKNGSNVPEIRFKGFTDDWEQRKLGELGSLKNGMNFSKEAMGIGFPFVNLQNIFGSSVIDVTNLGKAMASDSQLKDYNLLNGDVLFVRSSVKLEGVGEAALVPQNLENTTYSGFIIRFRDEYGLDNNFKRFLFGIESVRNQIMAQATNSANKNISQTVLENLCLKIPNKSEQEKIGLYFSNLDKLITLHQRELEKLKNVKKAMLEKMFV